MSFISDTREAFRNDDRDYETDYDYDRKRSYSRRESIRYDYDGYNAPDEDQDDEYEYEEERSLNPFKNFLERRRLKKEERLAEEEALRAELEEEERRAARPRTAKRNSSSSIQYASAGAAGADVELVVFYPKTFDDSDRIVEAVQQGKLALFIFEEGDGARNSETTSNGAARRIVDYVGGAAKGMGCGFGRLSSGIFCIAPKNVKIPQERGRRGY